MTRMPMEFSSILSMSLLLQTKSKGVNLSVGDDCLLTRASV
uniref:Uncharacterized protein n=1 Tax=Arundo donax TaxID=35708 RepID=A0A0A9C620_ARUDO